METHKRWSRLQKRLYMLTDERINFRLRLSVYRMQSACGSVDLPRYWITLGDEIIFDYPKDFIVRTEKGAAIKDNSGRLTFGYPYLTRVSDISALIREYIDAPAGELFDRQFGSDKWGLADIFRAADRRIGKRRLALLGDSTESPAVRKIIAKRLAGGKERWN